MTKIINNTTSQTIYIIAKNKRLKVENLDFQDIVNEINLNLDIIKVYLLLAEKNSKIHQMSFKYE